VGAIVPHRGGGKGAVGCISVLNWWLEYIENKYIKFQIDRMKCKVRPFFFVISHRTMGMCEVTAGKERIVIQNVT